MNLRFFKYQGTGNDFILIDDRSQTFDKNDTDLIARLCDRRFGIGADGLILLQDNSELDFTMVYCNSDGRQGSMCGNGGRCMVAFAEFLGIIKEKATFEAIDGIHEASIANGMIRLHMRDVKDIVVYEGHIFLDTGSPHHIEVRQTLKDLDLVEEGRRIRYGELYGQEGCNVNFVRKVSEDTFQARTYERGVEEETLSCGTGVTAVAIAMHSIGETQERELTVRTQGGDLKVSFSPYGKEYKEVFLEGPAVQVFKGIW